MTQLCLGMSYSGVDQCLSHESDVFDHVATLLESGTAPADLRAALYRALALVPDVTITNQQAALDGRRGTAFGLPRDGVKNQQELIIDAVTGGGPAGATTTLVYKVYADGRAGSDLGGSAAQSVILMIIVIALTAVQFRYIERKVQY